MKTLWIRILGFSSGRTGWVMTKDEQPPYEEDGVTPTTRSNGVLCRFDIADQKKLRSLANDADRIKVFAYGNHKPAALVTKKRFLDAVGGDEFSGDHACLTDLMPRD